MYRLTWPLLLALLAVSCSAAQEVRDDDDLVAIETEGEEEREDVPYASPNRPQYAHFVEHFDSLLTFEKDWVRSKAKKDDADEDIAKYDGEWSIEPLVKNPLVGDRGLVLKSVAKHAAISSRLTKPFHFLDKQLVVQFEVGLQNGQSCGGAYIKLLADSPQLDLTGFRDQTPYTIMFGPDKCGNENKVHFIFRHRNPLTGEFEEKHAKRVSDKLEAAFSDKQVHQYRLVVRPDNTFQIYLDDRVINSGSLLEDMTPPVNPPSEIDDPEDFKPEEWDERERIPDPDATKPDDWDEDAPAKIADSTAAKPAGWLDDELSMIPDPIASRPSDWDDEMDGEWEAPMVDNPLCADAPGCGTWSPPIIDNPAYRGKWRRPMIANPEYRGKWAPRRIANPGYFEDKQPFKMTSIGAVGFELWSMSDGIYFDNVLVSDSLVEAQQYTDDTFALKVKQHGLKESTMITRFLKYSSDRPWLFAIYVVVIGLPILLLLTYCCTTAKKSPDARHKKTDDVTEDDTIPEEPEEEAETSAGGGKTAEDAGDDPADDDPAADEADSAGDAASADADEPAVNPPLRTSPRKRRSRLE